MAAMTETRSLFSAVAFADRYILAIGGYNGNYKMKALASVEIYDAQEGCWAPYASLATARYSQGWVCKLWLHLFLHHFPQRHHVGRKGLCSWRRIWREGVELGGVLHSRTSRQGANLARGEDSSWL